MSSKRPSKRLRDFQRGADQAHAEGQGVYQLEILSFLDALVHKRGSQMIRQLVTSGAKGAPMICLFCDTEFGQAHPPVVIVVMSAYCEGPTKMMGTGICRSCAEPGDTLNERVLAMYRANVMPDMRTLHLSADRGRA